MCLRRPNRRKEAGRPLYESQAFSNFYIESSGGHVSGTSVTAPISWLRHAFLRVRASSINTSPSLHHSSVKFWVRQVAFLNSKDTLPLNLTLEASKRTKNATGAVVKDNGFIVGLNPGAGSPEGWHWRYHRGPWNMAATWLDIDVGKGAGLQRNAPSFLCSVRAAELH